VSEQQSERVWGIVSMKSLPGVRRVQFPLFVATLLAAMLTIFGSASQEALASPSCTAFANTPTFVAGRVESNGGVTCTSSVTGLFRVDVTLYRDGSEVGRSVNACHGEQQCGALVSDADVDGGQEWCAMAVGAFTGGSQVTGGAPRTEMICENEAY
jgi:hypothetical protein